MNPNNLGQRLRARRQVMGIDQRTLAEIAGVSVHALSNLESGTGNPTLTLITQVATALGLELTLQIRTATVDQAVAP
jgi:transcriptional regulator with XRE-family HTH domain